MGIYTRVKAFASDEEFQKHLKVAKFCKEMDIPIHPKSAEFFRNLNMEDPLNLCDEDLEEILEISIENCITENSSHEMENRWEIDVDELPPEVKTIRFTNSY